MYAPAHNVRMGQYVNVIANITGCLPQMPYFAGMLPRIYLLIGCILLVTNASAQKAKQYPQGYFRNPLDIPILLAGNFGECRPNHFHSGLDIKTQGKENMPVYAAADGYISRIKMEKGGFGHALYITHPNGYTTVYAHLNKFMPAVQKYMKAAQYKNRNWQVDLQPGPSQFLVKKGEQIAWSGNTGGSTAPHLHFEIRNTATEHPLNPQLFGFDITDNVAPKPTQIAIYDWDKGVYEQTPHTYELVKKGDIYTTKDTVYANYMMAGVGIKVNDYMNNSDNTLTYHTVKLTMNKAPFITIVLDDIGYDETRYLHALADYKTLKQKGEWIQCLFQQDGNRLDSIYHYASQYRRYTQRGKLEFADETPKDVRIEITDAAGNATIVNFPLVYRSVPDTTIRPCTEELKFEVFKENSFVNPNVELMLDDKALYESLCFTFSAAYDSQAYSARYDIHKPYVPLHTWATLRIKPDKAIPFDKKDKIALAYSDGKNTSAKGAVYDNGWYKASIRNFGTYYLVADDVPPVITSLQKEGAVLAQAGAIRFIAKEALTSVKSFTAELNGKWICFEQMGDTFVYEFDEHCKKGKHKLVVSATDENNNTQTLTYNFKR